LRGLSGESGVCATRDLADNWIWGIMKVYERDEDDCATPASISATYASYQCARRAATDSMIGDVCLGRKMPAR
jgi:hypothetical protein